MDNPAVLFVAPASPVTGRGHLNRCRAIADALGDLGITSGITDPDGAVHDGHVPSEQVGGFLAGHQPVLVFTDNYAWRHSRPDLAGIENAMMIAAIDDFGDRPPGCGLVFRQTRAGQAELAGTDPEIREGEQLAVVRPAFFNQRRNRTRNGRLLVCLGASQAGLEATSRVLSALSAAGCASPVDIALPDAGDQRAALLEAAGNLDITLLEGLTDLSPVMAAAEAVICTPSVTAFEAATLGKPLLCILIADNQQRLADHLVRKGAAVTLSVEAPQAELIEAVRDFPASSGSDASRLRCDGLGARRIARRLAQVLDGVEDDGLRLEPAIAGDVEPTYRLQCLPETRAFARNPEAPSLDGHTAWFNGTLVNGARELFMIFWQDEIAGFIRVDRLETLADGTDHYEISIATDPAYWGRGFASKALHYLFDLFPRDVFIAHVLPGNERSHALFRRCGFIWRDGRYERAPRRETGSGRMTTESR